MAQSKRHNTETNDPHWIEWITGVFSCLLVGAMIGWIAWQAIMADNDPPRLSTSVTHIEKSGELFRVEFEVTNASPTSAAAVTIAGEMRGDNNTGEAGEVTFDYVPAQSKARGALLFRTDPAGRELRIRPSGYAEP